MVDVAIASAGQDAQWDALKLRDRAAEGAFVYAVSTTGVYCRPSCPSRLPRRENVRFFATNNEAEQAGFRACKRCKPNEPALLERQTDTIAKACALIDASEEKPDFDAIARQVQMSRHHFHRVFKQVAGVTPGDYLRGLRKRRAIGALGNGATVTEAIYDAGYSSSSRFYETFAQDLGVKPGAFKNGGTGENIRFAVGKCTLGSILVAATEKGLCAIEFGDDPKPLVEGLQDRFPNAELIGGDAHFEGLVAKVVGFVEEPERGLELPLHVRGTAFQQKVWQILRGVPFGETKTYAEIAAMAGMPRAVRAVANACARNKLAVAIPCHRVVRTDGSLSGYRWGVERKATLLAREAV